MYLPPPPSRRAPRHDYTLMDVVGGSGVYAFCH